MLHAFLIMIHSYSWLNDKQQVAEYSQDKAKQLLINASWKINNNLFSLGNKDIRSSLINPKKVILFLIVGNALLSPSRKKALILSDLAITEDKIRRVFE